MDKGQEQWDRLVNLPEEYEVNPSIAQRAIEELSAQPAEPKKGWFARQWKAIVGVAAVAVLLVGIGIPIYNKLSTPQIIYYEKNDVVYADLENPTAFVNEKGLNILYFDSALSIVSQSATIVETGEFAFLEQETLHMTENGFFDKVVLRSVAKQKAEFSFYQMYTDLTEIQSVRDLSISYALTERVNTGNTQVLARFTYQNAEYFLDITTEEDGVRQLETYVSMLLP